MSYLEDPRVFFAAERTYLAWLRTAIAIMGLGFIIDRFGVLILLSKTDAIKHEVVITKVISIGMILAGLILSVGALRQYNTILKGLGPKEIPEGYSMKYIYAAAMILCAVSLIMGYVICTV